MTPKAVSKKRGDRKGTALGMAAGLGWKEPRWDSEGVGPEDRGLAQQPEDPEPSGRGAEGRLQSYLAGRTERTDILGIPAVFQALCRERAPCRGGDPDQNKAEILPGGSSVEWGDRGMRCTLPETDVLCRQTCASRSGGAEGGVDVGLVRDGCPFELSLF